MNAFEQAKELYESNGKDFEKVLIDHLETGIVVSSPMWFLMLRAEQWNVGNVWFVECGIGDLRQLAKLITLRLPYIAFCRVKNGKKQTKVYETDRLLRLAQREVEMP